ncbi:MAG: hypothetical protein KAI17_27145 [Thiotrichaceae bacterium]|nr:hypothetical protein [Thiotrichaceae bacterium]
MNNMIYFPKLTIILLMLFFSLNSYADGDDSWLFKRWFSSSNTGISTVKFAQYNDLCGHCHFPYQPGLLPGISWEKMMNNPDKHFSQSLEMTDVEIRTMRRYLLNNSAGHVNDRISNEILQSFSYEPIPIRITQTPFFLHKHQKQANIKNMGQCDSCHQDARQGAYHKDKISMPVQSQ